MALNTPQLAAGMLYCPLRRRRLERRRARVAHPAAAHRRRPGGRGGGEGMRGPPSPRAHDSIDRDLQPHPDALCLGPRFRNPAPARDRRGGRLVHINALDGDRHTDPLRLV